MAINSCSINEHTVNSLCGSRRQAIIDSLLDYTPPPAPQRGHPQQVHPDTRIPLEIFRRDREEEHDFRDTELPYITVTAEVYGQIQMATHERTESNALVTVSGVSGRYGVTTDIRIIDLNIGKIDSTDVNIFDIKIKVI